MEDQKKKCKEEKSKKEKKSTTGKHKRSNKKRNQITRLRQKMQKHDEEIKKLSHACASS